jgi:HEPN domain-containing protein
MSWGEERYFMNEEYLQEWIRKAEEDNEAAVALARIRKRPTPNAIGFHCQQCIEKYLKAFLVLHDVDFPRIHDLLELQKMCIPINSSFERIGDLLDELNPYAVEFRYPGEEVTIDEAKAAVKAMRKARVFIRKILFPQ